MSGWGFVHILYFSIMKKGKKTIKGESYKRRVLEINAIYDKYARSGLSNREIIRLYIWPIYPISEKTFYNCINALPRFIEDETK